MLSELLVYVAPSSIEFVNTYTQNYCCLISWPLLRFLLLALRMRAYAELSPITTDDASCFGASWLRCLISRSTRSAKLPLFQKAVAVVVIVELACIAFIT